MLTENSEYNVEYFNPYKANNILSHDLCCCGMVNSFGAEKHVILMQYLKNRMMLHVTFLVPVLLRD